MSRVPACWPRHSRSPGRLASLRGEVPCGDNPPFRQPVFVVTHRPRAMVTKQGGTTYIFVTGGLEATEAHARATAGDRDVAVIGGATIIRQCLQAGLLD